MAEGGGLLNRYRGLNPYRGFESPSLRHCYAGRSADSGLPAPHGMLSMVKIRSKKRTRRARSPCDVDGGIIF